MKSFKKAVAVFTAALVVLVSNPGIALAQSFSWPTPPPAPTAPPEPTSPPSLPTQPPSPTYPPTPTPYGQTPAPSTAPSSQETTEPSGIPTPTATSSASAQSSGDSGASGTGTGGQRGDGGSGGTINTGGATNTAGITNDANNNLSDGGMSPCESCVDGISIVNDGNGTDSTNSGSVGVTDNNNTLQTNGAYVVNDLSQSTVTGDNSVSRNTGGDNVITTGDANTTGTIVNSLNTNLDGVVVYEFNVADDHLGDYVLDFSPENCVSGCGTGDTKLANIDNGSGSANTTDANLLTNNNTFQTNDATVENNMALLSDSGSNEADRNTSGDSSITTGDANVAANALTFTNNNIEGGVVYAVVNIFGNLIGDIIFPDGSSWACCGGDTNATNLSNGTNSTNSASVDTTNNNNLFQFNDADIQNNLNFAATTGNNDVNDNTSGNNSVATGSSNVIAQAVNFVNNNLAGGNYWLVIVNEGGRWLGRIVGTDDGVNMFGSEAFEFAITESGEIIVTNSGNGSGSTNTGTLNQTTNNTLVQTNNANIVNNINLSANTGENSTSKNTGGNNSIVTGDANIIANIVNFVNNNITGGGKLFVTVVNVFGSWLGDFVGPGYEKDGEAALAQTDSNQNPNVGGGTENLSGSTQAQGQNSSGATSGTSQLILGTLAYGASGSANSSLGNLFFGGGISENDGTAGGQVLADATGKEKVYINLAIPLFVLLLASGVYVVIKRIKFVLVRRPAAAA